MPSRPADLPREGEEEAHCVRSADAVAEECHLETLPKGAATTARPAGQLPAGTTVVTGHRMPVWGTISALLENEAILGYVLMIPALLLIVVFIAYPFSLGIWMALTDKLVGRPVGIVLIPFT